MPIPRPLTVFLHSCKIKSGSGLGTRLKYLYMYSVHRAKSFIGEVTGYDHIVLPAVSTMSVLCYCCSVDINVLASQPCAQIAR